MNTLREAVGEYLETRRGLGFKLKEAGKGLIDFITPSSHKEPKWLSGC